MSEKTERRKAAELRRKELARPGFAEAIAAYADTLALFERAIVAGYWAIRDEADPRALMLKLTRRGHPLALPALAGRQAALRFHAWKEGDALRRAAFGLSEPLDTAPVVKPDVLLVPLLAFDAEGYRLGYGGGYYDRTLAALRAQKRILAVGIAYAGQEVAALPADGHDQRLDAVLTESGFRRFREPPDCA